MPKIIQLSAHVANLIAAGEVVERPASAVKELLENAVDAGATKITVEIRDGGMTFLRVTDNGCGMSPEDAKTAFLRHATSKLRSEQDLAAITHLGFRGEALAAIASVSRIELLTKTADAIAGTGLQLEAGQILSSGEAGCPDGTTIIVRDLFFNTPARMKFMRSDTVEGSRVASAVQLQALAHPEVAFQFIRDGKQVLATPGTGGLQAAVYCVYGRGFAQMVSVDSRWEQYTLTGYVSKPTDARPSRNFQTFFVNHRPVKSKLLQAALEEAYRNQIMVGKFPACVLHLNLPAAAVDVNVHPAKTEVKFLSEKAVFDCVHYGVLAALNKQIDRPAVQFPQPACQDQAVFRSPVMVPKSEPAKTVPTAPVSSGSSGGNHPFFRTMTPQEYKTFSAALETAPAPKAQSAAQVLAKIPIPANIPISQVAGAAKAVLPKEEAGSGPAASPAPVPEKVPEKVPENVSEPEGAKPLPQMPETEVPAEGSEAAPAASQPEQMELDMPPVQPWRYVGELYNSYILVEQGEEAFLIDKHAAHERILFEKLKAHQEPIASQALLTPMPVRLTAAAAGELLANPDMLEELGFSLEEFGSNTLLLRQVPMDLAPEEAADTLEILAAGLLGGRRERKDTVRDEVLHSVACKAAIKAGQRNDPQELQALVETVMRREELKYCPHGRPICITLSKKQLEKQFKRT